MAMFVRACRRNNRSSRSVVHRVAGRRQPTAAVRAPEHLSKERVERGFIRQMSCVSLTSDPLLRRNETNSKRQQQASRSCFNRAADDADHQGSISLSSRQLLWEEMAPETRRLARSIISHRSDFVAHHKEFEDHLHETDRADSTESKPDLQKPSPNGIHPRVGISRAITLMESKHPVKKKQGDLLLTYLLSLTSTSSSADPESSVPNETLRVGFAGPPGAGKSSMLEALGTKLLEDDPERKLAVVCIDPSSNLSGGSILGDKTRMTQLSRQSDRALVRPSSNSGVLGGLAAYTDDVVRLLGCAGYPLVLVETVGLGQSEIEVAQSVDVLVLLVPPSGGDELQGVKKGIVELADVLAVTKTDGDLEAAANQTAADYRGALRVLHQSHSSSGSGSSCGNDDKEKAWMPPVVRTSSVTKRGLEDLWQAILEYQEHLRNSGKWEDRRRKQAKYWMWKQFGRMMHARMQEDSRLRERAHQLERDMLDGLLTPRVSAQVLMDELFESTNHKQ